MLCILMVAEMVKSLPAMQETRARSLDQDDRLQKEMATHSSILAWRIPWTVEPGGLQSMESRSQTQPGNEHLWGRGWGGPWSALNMPPP